MSKIFCTEYSQILHSVSTLEFRWDSWIIMYVLELRTVSALTRGLFWCLLNKYQKITLEWAQKQFVTKVHILFYFLHDITNPWMTIKTTVFTHHPRVLLARFSFCWWRNNRLLMTSQWQEKWGAIFNSLNINFIHSDIHRWLCLTNKYRCGHRLDPMRPSLCPQMQVKLCNLCTQSLNTSLMITVSVVVSFSNYLADPSTIK